MEENSSTIAQTSLAASTRPSTPPSARAWLTSPSQMMR